jgi:hypothetical protein
MPRFNANRWWAFILALSVSLTSIAAMSRHAIAGVRMGEGGGGTITTGDPGLPPPPGAGDPDIPLPSKSSIPKVSAQRGAQTIASVRAVGDGSAPSSSVMMWRLQAVLQSLRLWFVRF